MLMKISHICFCGNPIETQFLLEAIGYRSKFSTVLRPMNITQQLISKPVKKIKMSFWESLNSICIEVLEFDDYSFQHGLIKPIFIGNSDKSKFIAVSNRINVDENCNYKIGNLLGTEIYYDISIQADDFFFSSFLIVSNNFNKSIFFWKTLGFNLVKNNFKEALLEFKCFFTKNFVSLHLIYDETKQIVFEDIDSLGFHVIGFISNSTYYERERMKKYAFAPTDIEQIKLNNNVMDIFYLRSPEGLIIEIISLVNS